MKTGPCMFTALETTACSQHFLQIGGDAFRDPAVLRPEGGQPEMRELVDGHPVCFELIDRRIRRWKQENRRAATSTHHPEGHLLLFSWRWNDNKVNLIAREPVAD